MTAQPGTSSPAETYYDLRPGDEGLLQEFVLGLSEKAYYLRFFAPSHPLPEPELARLVNVGPRSCALAVMVGGRIVGVGRYMHLEGDCAEPAIVITDNFQGNGIGRRLMSELIRRAHEDGIRTFKTERLATNEAILKLLLDLGLEWTPESRDGSTVSERWALPAAA